MYVVFCLGMVIKEYLVEGFVAQSTQFNKVGEAEGAVLDDEAQQLGERFQETLQHINTFHLQKMNFSAFF